MAQYIDLTARRRPARATSTAVDAATWATALLVGAAGAIHLYLWFDYFQRVHVVGALFLANAGAGIAIGAALLARPARPPSPLAAGGYAAGTLAAFAISTRWGLFGY